MKTRPQELTENQINLVPHWKVNIIYYVSFNEIQ